MSKQNKVSKSVKSVAKDPAAAARKRKAQFDKPAKSKKSRRVVGVKHVNKLLERAGQSGLTLAEATATLKCIPQIVSAALCGLVRRKLAVRELEPKTIDFCVFRYTLNRYTLNPAALKEAA